MHLFEIEVKNRVVKKGLNLFRIKGKQGNWYTETLCYLADSREETEKFATDEIMNRRILGITKYREREWRREIKIIKIRRLV